MELRICCPLACFLLTSWNDCICLWDSRWYRRALSSDPWRGASRDLVLNGVEVGLSCGVWHLAFYLHFESCPGVDYLGWISSPQQEKDSWMNINQTNPACPPSRSAQSMWSSMPGLSISLLGGHLEIWRLIFARLQCWHSVVLGPSSLTPRALTLIWWRLIGPGCPRRECHNCATPFESGRGSLEIRFPTTWQVAGDECRTATS